jgi:uncharacterized protein
MRKLSALSFFLLLALAAQAQVLKSFPLSSVRLLESPFYQAQQTDMAYILALDPDRLLAPFLLDAGITPKAKGYGNWENTGLDGHIGGHYLSALSLMYASTKNAELKQRLEYMVDQLAICQTKNGDGYVGGIPGGHDMWKDIATGKIDAGSFSLNHKWVPLYNIHKLYAGLRDAYLIAGNEKAKEILIKLSDWCLNITANLSDAQIQDILRSEHGGMNEVFADVAEITGDQKYLKLAQRFSHQAILQPLLENQDKLTGMHANTQIPKVIGFKRVTEVGGDESWAKAADFFWNTVVDHRTVSIGGNSVREHFHPSSDFSSMIESNQGPETCNTYNMLRLAKMLFLSNPDPKYMQYFERALYNHILSSQHPNKGGFVYFTPMRPRHYRVYSNTQEDFWCCVGSGLENHGKYGELIYAHNDQDLYVNLFMASELEWKEKGITLTQKTQFPFQETSEIKLDLKKSQKFNLLIRYPSWVAEGKLQISVNGKPEIITAKPSSYVAISRKWKSGDVVTIALPMHIETEFMPDQSPWISFVYGPIVLAAATDATDLKGLWADGSRMGHVAEGGLYPVEEAPMILKKSDNWLANIQPVKDKPLTFSAKEIILPEKYQNVQLVPFFTLHETRYSIYWPIATPEELEQKKKAIREKEEAMLALEKQTVDQVAPGEQQPESDHHFQGEKTESGIHLGHFWRHAAGWFSYDLRNKNHEAKTLRVTYSGGDAGRKFDILINGKLLKTVQSTGEQGNRLFDVDYELPAEILSGNPEILTVKFAAHEGSIAGGVYYVRLLK